MATIVLVPGGYHGGWYFAPIMNGLRESGHDVHAITLSGLGSSGSSCTGSINLDTHIADLTGLIKSERLTDIILCGHSYAGMVIAGAASMLPGNVRSLVFLDALVPADGDSVWSMWDPETRHRLIDAATDGFRSVPPEGLDARAQPHPLATWLQPIRLSAQAYAAKHKIYAWCNGQTGSPFHNTYQRLKSDTEWMTYTLNCGHDVIGEAPDLALALLLEVAAME